MAVPQIPMKWTERICENIRLMIGCASVVKREKNPHRIPVALTIAGSDSGGGAGIQADLKAFSALGVHGATVLTCVTAQNPRQVFGIMPCSARMVRNQLQAVFEELPPMAVKTGMLYSTAIIQAVADFIKKRPAQLIVDPVMVSSSGVRLLKRDAIQMLCRHLIPLATLVTPNLSEAEVLLDLKLTSVEDLRVAAKKFYHRFGTAALIKGGHLRGLREAVDIFYDGRVELLLSAPFVRGLRTHGTGCTYSAAITGFLARGFSLSRSVANAKEFITRAIMQSQTAGGHSVLNSFWTQG
jgi:hydroxymethylpyrimidine/phosphomethylpyrimidine kinase